MKAETTNIFLPATVFEAGADKDIELESTLADYLPNINRIIRADADIVCDDVRIENGKAEICGKAVFSLLYESDFKQKLWCEKFSTDFTHRFDLKDLPDVELYPTAQAKCSYVGCKTLNPRRFILRCRADLALTIKCMQSLNIVSMDDCKGAYFQSTKHNLAVYTPCIVRDFSMEENISLEAMSPVNDIIYTTIDFTDGEISVLEGSAEIHAEASFKCLYEKEGEDGGLQLATKRFPVNFTVDDEQILADSVLSFKLYAKNMETEKEIDAYGENRVIQLRYGVRAELECVNRQQIEVPTDMFFDEYDNENKLQVLPYEEPAKEVRHRFTVEKIFEIPEMAIDNCIDFNVDISVSETVANEDGLSIKGSCGMNIFGIGADTYRAHDFNIPFSELMPLTVPNTNCRFKVSAEAQNPVAEVSGGRLSVRIPVQLSACVVYKQSLSALVSAEIEKRSDLDNDSTPIIIYYPQKGETAWEIGKRYYTNPAEICENNADAFDKSGVIANDGVMLYM